MLKLISLQCESQNYNVTQQNINGNDDGVNIIWKNNFYHMLPSRKFKVTNFQFNNIVK